MKKKGRDSKVINAALTSFLVLFVCLLSFSVGVLSGKGWSDREHTLKTIEENTQFANKVIEGEGDSSPLSADMTEKEVEILAQKALEEARKGKEDIDTAEAQEAIAEMEQINDLEKIATGENADNKEKVAADDSKDKRNAASVADTVKKPTLPKAKSIEWTVQVASYATSQEAEEHSNKLIEKGFPAFPVSAEINGRLWYRVSIGSFKNRKEALQYEQDLKKQAVVKSSFVHKITRN